MSGAALGGDVLPRAVRSMAAAADPSGALRALAELVVPEVADWCLGDVLQPPDLVTRVAAVGRQGPLDLPVELGPVAARRSSARAVGVLPLLLATSDRSLRLSGDHLRAMATAHDPKLRRQVELAVSLGSTDVLVLGLTRRDELLGVLTVGRSGGGFNSAQVALLRDLGAVAGLVLDAHRLLEVQRDVSTALQRSLLPQLPVVPGVTLAARFAPAGRSLSVGGDWYDAFVLPDGALALVVGDATGHDVLAAARMAELRNLLRALAADQQEPPAATLSRLDQVGAHLAPDLSGTCVYAQLEHGRRLRWSSAGHLPPVLLRGGSAELLETPPDLMLGVRAWVSRRDHRRDLEAGDVLVLYTDGLVEDRGSSLDDRLLVLARLVERIGASSPEQLADALAAQLPAGDDDVAVLVVRIDT